jgi:hypothetical protein
MTLSTEQRRALTLLAGAGLRGIAESLMVNAHGFTIELMVKLIGDGLVSAETHMVGAGRQKIEVLQLRITDAGRQVLAPH